MRKKTFFAEKIVNQKLMNKTENPFSLQDDEKIENSLNALKVLIWLDPDRPQTDSKWTLSHPKINLKWIPIWLQTNLKFTQNRPLTDPKQT